MLPWWLGGSFVVEANESVNAPSSLSPMRESMLPWRVGGPLSIESDERMDAPVVG